MNFVKVFNKIVLMEEMSFFVGYSKWLYVGYIFNIFNIVMNLE